MYNTIEEAQQGMDNTVAKAIVDMQAACEPFVTELKRLQKSDKIPEHMRRAIITKAASDFERGLDAALGSLV